MGDAVKSHDQHGAKLVERGARHLHLSCESDFVAFVLEHHPCDPDPFYNHRLSYFVLRTAGFLLAMVSENPSGGPFCLFNGSNLHASLVFTPLMLLCVGPGMRRRVSVMLDNPAVNLYSNFVVLDIPIWR